MKESMDIESGTRYARDLWTGEDSGWGRDDVEHDLKIEAARALRRILCVQVRFPRRITAPIAGVGDVTLSHVCPHCHCFPLEDHIWWVSSQHGEGNNRTKKQCSGGARHAAANTTGARPTVFWSYKTARTPEMQMFFELMRHRRVPAKT